MEGLGTWQDVSFVASPHGMSQTDAATAVKKDGSLLSWSCEQDLRLFYDVLTDVAHWRDVTKLCMNPQFTAGLQSNGRVCATAGAPEAIAAWSDIVDIASAEGMKEGSAFILGLKKGGSVLFAGEDDAGQGDVQGWRDCFCGRGFRLFHRPYPEAGCSRAGTTALASGCGRLEGYHGRLMRRRAHGGP